MSEMFRTVSRARFTSARFAGLAVLAVSLLVSACSGSDAIDPLSATASFDKGGNGDGNGGGGGGDNIAPSQGTSLATPQATLTIDGNTVTLSWPAVAGAIDYQINSSAAGIHTPFTTATSVTATVANGTYTWKIRARTTPNNNESGWSDELTFTVNVSTEVEPPAGDNTPPVIAAPVITGTLGSDGWYTSDVTVTWSATDAESDVTLSGCSVSVTADTQGTTYTCTATSAGGSSTASITIKRDATVPTVAFAGNLFTYTVDQTISITCTATDAMSGIATATCPTASGDAYLFNIGSNALVASATDKAGNSNGTTTSFTVSVTAGSLCNLTRRFVSHAGIANSLCVKLNAAEAAAARGNLAAKAGPLNAYVKEVQAQTGKAISAANAAILIRLAGLL